MKKKLVYLIIIVLCLGLVWEMINIFQNYYYVDVLKKIPNPISVFEVNTTEELAAKLISVEEGTNISVEYLNWDKEGEIEGGKVFYAEYNGNKVYFRVRKNGDYIEYLPIETYIINKAGERVNLAQIIFELEYNKAMKELDF